VVGGREEDLAYWKHRAAFPNVIFHGYVYQGGIDRYYRLFDIALLPYQSRVTLEGGKGDTVRWMSPLKLFEYMACGKAIIASDLPVLREVLTHGETALMVPPEDIDAWADALSTLEGNPSFRERLGREARRLLAEEYSWRKRADRVLT
jgi:glycosyltransferase involved in cell wall biosynthesis